MEIINEATEGVAVEDLTLHPRNPNQADVGAIHQSIEANGFYGAIVAQRSTGHVLAGNHRLLAAQQAGMDEVPVIWVDVDDDHALRILLADNRTTRLGVDDPEQLADLLQEVLEDAGTLDGTGYDGDVLDELLADLALDDDSGLADNFSRKIEAPIYTPKGDRPSEGDLYDRARTDALLAEIDAAHDLPPDVAAFLRNAAERHTVFRFDQIAEYYAHATAEVQDLMERSALIIIDFDRAVELGYVKLTEKILEQAGYSKGGLDA